MTTDDPARPRSIPRLPLTRRVKFCWALGSLGDNYAGNTINQLKDAVYTVALGVPPAWVGWALFLPRVVDSLLDPLVGAWSDRRGGRRWGRRRPLILFGGMALAITMLFVWMPPLGPSWTPFRLAVYLSAASTLFYCAYSLFLVPYRALGLELAHDYHERTRLQGWGMIVGLVGGLGIPWLFKLTVLVGEHVAPAASTAGAIVTGVRWVGAGVGLLMFLSCLAPALACAESKSTAPAAATPFYRTIGTTLANRPFVQMLGMNFFAILALSATTTVTLVLTIFYLFHGSRGDAATLIGYLGFAQMLGSLVGIPFNTWASVRLGKRGAVWVGLATAALGYVSLWRTLVPAHPHGALASFFLVGWGLQGVWLMSATMNADVCDADQLVTGSRNEGIYGAVFGLEQKLAFAAAAVIGGYVAQYCGYDPSLAPSPEALHRLRIALVASPLLCLAAAALCMCGYSLSQRRLEEIQAQLARARASGV